DPALRIYRLLKLLTAFKNPLHYTKFAWWSLGKRRILGKLHRHWRWHRPHEAMIFDYERPGAGGIAGLGGWMPHLPNPGVIVLPVTHHHYDSAAAVIIIGTEACKLLYSWYLREVLGLMEGLWVVASLISARRSSRRTAVAAVTVLAIVLGEPSPARLAYCESLADMEAVSKARVSASRIPNCEVCAGPPDAHGLPHIPLSSSAQSHYSRVTSFPREAGTPGENVTTMTLMMASFGSRVGGI
ncbi:hypothetical protein FOZ62_025487, partial [Perkinsus olseni]